MRNSRGATGAHLLRSAFGPVVLTPHTPPRTLVDVSARSGRTGTEGGDEVVGLNVEARSQLGRHRPSSPFRSGRLLFAEI